MQRRVGFVFAASSLPTNVQAALRHVLAGVVLQQAANAAVDAALASEVSLNVATNGSP
jgi:hypothetical protein